MSEKIYAWLLRLFPSRFREAYREEALQLFRDRARDEKGFFRRPRLWLDLLTDLAISVPREYLHAQPELAGAAADLYAKGTPSFYVLGDETPRAGALFLGGVLSLSALVGVSILLTHGGNFRPLHASARQSRREIAARRSAFKGAVQQSADGAGEEAVESGQPGMSESARPIGTATGLGTGETRPGNSQSDTSLSVDSYGSSRPQALQPRDAATAMTTTEAGSRTPNAGERQRVVAGAIANLKEYYVDRNVAEKMANALEEHAKSGDDDAAADGEAFAELLTKQMRDVSDDMHLELVYSQAALPEQPAGPTPEGLARYRKAMEQENCMFEKVEMLAHNVGYVKLTFFPDTSVCRPTATAAMASLNDADAVIFDLRDNAGGFQNMVALISSYLFDHPEYLYSPREAPTQQSWTASPVPGNRLADKPVYVLTSARTISGAEQFCYDLKMLKRVTLVGETTAGSAH
ncbi:MAG: S41 family peptidase, partial [Candidatus Acidiferrum sp.]